jgi:hypothetical protein
VRWDVDVKSDESSLPRPKDSNKKQRCCGAGPTQGLEQLVVMHHELLSALGALIEQNQQILSALGQVTQDWSDEPTGYLDGSKV